MHPWIAHLRQNLVGAHVVPPHQVTQTAWTLNAETQVGGAWHEGEQLVGVLHFDFPERGRAQGAHAGLLVTDRRVVGRIAVVNIGLSLDHHPVDIAWSAVTGAAHEGGLLTNAVTVFSGPLQRKIPMFGDSLTRLFHSLAVAPPAQRTLGTAELTTHDHDAVGARGVAQRLVSGDPRLYLLAQLIDAQYARGVLRPTEAGDLLRRVQLFDATRVGGRAQHQGAWLSVLPRSILGEALRGALGAAQGPWHDGYAEHYEFNLGAGGRNVAGAAASTALGLASLAVLGVGWVSVPGGASLARLRLSLVDYPCGAGFVLAGSTGSTWGPMPLSAAPMLRGVLSGLCDLEARYLLLRAAHPATVPDAALFDTPAETVVADVTAAIGPCDLSVFLATSR